MTNKFPPNTDPNAFAFTAVTIAAIVAPEFNSYELNSIGNWLELLGQYFLAYAAQAQLVQSRYNNSFPGFDPEYIYSALQKITQELDQIKKEI